MDKQKTITDAHYGGKRKVVIDTETGEKEDVQVINHEATMDTNFHKVWLGHIVQALEIIGNKKIKVISYILENMSSENLLPMTQGEIADALGISRKTVFVVIDALRNADFIETKPGRIYVSPDLCFRGSHPRRMNILHRYERISKKQKEKDGQASPSAIDE